MIKENLMFMTLKETLFTILLLFILTFFRAKITFTFALVAAITLTIIQALNFLFIGSSLSSNFLLVVIFLSLVFCYKVSNTYLFYSDVILNSTCRIENKLEVERYTCY